MTAEKAQRKTVNVLHFLMLLIVALISFLAVVAAVIPTSPTVISKESASAPNPHNPAVQPLDLGALEAKGIAVYYSGGKNMPKQEVDGIGPVIGWKGHVVERHGTGTWEALWDELGKGNWNRYDCDDGKTYLIKRIPGYRDRWWFVVIGSKVIDSARLVITGFSGDRGAVLSPLDRDGCEPEFSIGHDVLTGS